ncbi:MAG TPA: AI-2E family transporter [Gammaproteobacteria bacterium]|nr:AI-2E family transporter [Gammaproteobacteria bacterium]
MKVLNYTATAILVVLVFYLLDVGQSLILPFVIAIALWYLINTLSVAFQKVTLGSFKFPPRVCLLASILSFLFVVWALISFLSGSLNGVLEVVPTYQKNLIIRLENMPFIDMALLSEQSLMTTVGNWIDLPAYAASVATSFASILASGGLILIYILFLFLEQGKFDQKITALFSEGGTESGARNIISRIRDDIQKYISIKMFTSTVTGSLSYIILMFLEVDFAGVWGLLIFLLNFIPTVGSIVATIFPALIALAQSDGYSLFLFVLAGIGACQILIGNILEPRMMGSSFNLSPIVILLNLALWGTIWGIIGMLLCVPFLIILTIVLSHFPNTRAIAIMLSSDGKLRVPLDSSLENFSFSAPNSTLIGSQETKDSE